jgi:hypothetical protein
VPGGRAHHLPAAPGTHGKKKKKKNFNMNKSMYLGPST